MKFSNLVQDANVWAKTMDQAFVNGDNMDILYEDIYERRAHYLGDSAIEILNTSPYVKTAIISIDEFPAEVEALKQRFGFVTPASMPEPQPFERPPVPPPAAPIPQSLPPVQPIYFQPPPVQQVEYILKKDDEDNKHEKNNMITRLYAMNLVGDVDLINRRITNF